jgi:hypothetical protein
MTPNLMGRLSMHSKCLDFFPFFFVPNMFPSSFQWIPIRFSICSLGSQCVPNSASLSSHMFCTKSSPPSHLYRWAEGGGTLSLHRIFYFLGAFIVSTFIFWQWANHIGSLQKKKKKKVGLVRHPQLINRSRIST